jgi:hypothetical protein
MTHRILTGIAGALLGSLPFAVPGQVVLTGELLNNAGAETGNLTGWTVVNVAGNTTPHADNGTYDPGYNPHTGVYDFVGDSIPGGGAQGFLRQQVDISSLSGVTTAQIDQGQIGAAASFWELSYNQGGTSDYARVGLGFYDGSSHLLGSVSSPDITSVDIWKQTQLTVDLPAGTRSIIYTMSFYRANNGGTYIDSFIDDNSLQLIAVPEPAAVSVATAIGLGVFSLWRRRR